jgi:outer membrane lipoprotein-sorting protein
MAEGSIETLKEINDIQRTITTLRANFAQTKFSSVFIEPLRSGGWMVLGKPNFLRWQYTYPETNGVMLYDNQIYQVKINQDKSEDILEADPWARMLINCIMEWAALDYTVLASKYKITQLSQAPVIVRLAPLKTEISQFLKSIVIEFSEDNAMARQIILTEPDEDETIILFSDMQINYQPSGNLLRK